MSKGSHRSQRDIRNQRATGVKGIPQESKGHKESEGLQVSKGSHRSQRDIRNQRGLTGVKGIPQGSKGHRESKGPQE